MKRILVFSSLLFLLAVFVFYLALPHLFPPLSVQECRKTSSYSDDRDYCYWSLAMIRGDEDLCQYLYYHDQDECREDARNARNTTSWQLKEERTEDDYTYRNSYYSQPERCAADGLIYTRVRYYTDYLDQTYYYYDFGYYDVEFAADCESVLKKSSENICSGEDLDYYDEQTCIRNIRLAKGLLADKVCEDAYDDCYSDYALFNNDLSACRTDNCFHAFAIRNNDPELCDKMSYGSQSCWFYFALKKDDPSYCDRFDDHPDLSHLCKAVLLAEQGS